MRKQSPKEMVLFLPSETGQPPRALAAELTAALPAGRTEVGIDLLSGGVEIRLYYDLAVLAQARAWLEARDIAYDVSFL
jgi:hypothetical protein